MRLFLLLGVLFLTELVHAGGPEYVAGSSFFDPTVEGTPLTWSQGAINYYTDQGNLSAILPGPNADSFVATAFSLWTSTPTAAISATHAGQLAEDVNGSNVTLINGVITLPADIQPGATATPVGIVYDADGSVTDALLGAGASNSSNCANAGAFGGIDNYGTNAQFLHALIVLNGNCAATSAQLPDLQYHLVRVIGRVLGLDWSQANLNAVTNNPLPSPNDYAGLPVMHEIDPPSCVPVAVCYSNGGRVNPAQPKMDDQAALSRLYPVTLQNLSSFPGKQIFSASTARIHGSVFFRTPAGQPGQRMQGVNVVARWVDPVTGVPSRANVASSVSGFLFCGNAGNIVTGTVDGTGQPLSTFGSNNLTLEGSYDLAGLQIPAGTSGQYQITVEAVDPVWSERVGPYGATSQVIPSGSALPVNVSVSLGSDVQQDIIMANSAVQRKQWYSPTKYLSPAQAPANGNWAGTLSAYGTIDYFQFAAQANRTLSVIVKPLDDSGNVTENKALPVIGMWALADPGQSPAPAFTPSAFNSRIFGESRLDAQILQSMTFRLGIADYRGDGRPDYHYNARVLYGDAINPARANVAGSTPLTIQGMGLQPDTVVQVGKSTLPLLASSATRVLVTTPHVQDGVYDLQLSDKKTGGASIMSGVLTVGAGPNDSLRTLSGSIPSTPVGGQAASPFSVLVLSSDGITPVAGASVQFSSSPAVAFSACAGAASCTVLTDQSGNASTLVTVLSTGTMTLTASLAPASYPIPQQVQTSLTGTSSSLDLSLLTPSARIEQGATVTIPLTARVLSNGKPMTNATVNYTLIQGTATLSAISAQTNSSGNASVNLQMKSVTANLQVNICIAPDNTPCQIFNAVVVPLSALQLQPVGPTSQVAVAGQSFQPALVRVTDSSTPPNPVIGANVFFQDYVVRTSSDQPIVWTGEAGSSQSGMPVVLSQSSATVHSDGNGLASFPLSVGGVPGDVAAIGSATAGNAPVEFTAQQIEK